MTSDKELWDRVLQGDADSFGELFQRHGQAIYNYCFRRTGNWAVAEDLVSTVFLEAWRRRRNVKSEEYGPVPWLLGVASNVVRNSQRSLRRYRAALSRLPSQPVHPDFADDLAARVDDEKRMRRILAIFSELPDRDQDVIALCLWQGLSYEQAGAALDLPVGTVKSRLSRARKRLRELIDRSGQFQGETRLIHEAARQFAPEEDTV